MAGWVPMYSRFIDSRSSSPHFMIFGVEKKKKAPILLFNFFSSFFFNFCFLLLYFSPILIAFWPRTHIAFGFFLSLLVFWRDNQYRRRRYNGHHSLVVCTCSDCWFAGLRMRQTANARKLVSEDRGTELR